MKKFFVLAAAAAVALSSCSKDKNEGSNNEPAQLAIKLANVVSTKAIEGKAETGAITELTGGQIFILDEADGVIDQEPLNVTAAQSNAGQRFPRTVKPNSKVFIVGNLPTGAPDNATLTKLSEIKAAYAAVSTQTDYKTATVANVDANPEPIVVDTDDTTIATVSVKLEPVIARLELVQLQNVAVPEDGKIVAAYTVKGVYLDNYYPEFNYGGSYHGVLFSQGQSTEFNGVGDATEVTASAEFVAAPADSKVWAYNVAAGNQPKVIVHVEAGTEEPVSKYLQIKSYKALGNAAFEPGYVYRISSLNFEALEDEESGEIDSDDLGDEPNETDVNLTVEVSVVPWTIVDPLAEI